MEFSTTSSLHENKIGNFLDNGSSRWKLIYTYELFVLKSTKTFIS